MVSSAYTYHQKFGTLIEPRYLIDAITLSPSPTRGPHKITTKNVNKNANSDAKSLLSYLGSIYGKKILSGQQDQASLDWVTTNVGKTPAILGVDFMGMRRPYTLPLPRYN